MSTGHLATFGKSDASHRSGHATSKIKNFKIQGLQKSRTSKVKDIESQGLRIKIPKVEHFERQEYRN